MVGGTLTDSGLLKFQRGELMQTAACLANLAPHAALKNGTPYRALHNKQAKLERLLMIGA